jgi:hypothetical protein
MTDMHMTAGQYAEIVSRMARVGMVTEKEAKIARDFADIAGRIEATSTISVPLETLEDLVGAEADRSLGW